MKIPDDTRFYLLEEALLQGSKHWCFIDEEATGIIRKYPGDEETAMWNAILAGEEIPICHLDTGKFLGFISLESIELGEDTLWLKQLVVMTTLRMIRGTKTMPTCGFNTPL